MLVPSIQQRPKKHPAQKQNLKIPRKKTAVKQSPAKKAGKTKGIAAVTAATNPATVRPILQWDFLYFLRLKPKAILQKQKNKNSDSKKPTILQAIPLSGYRLK